MPQQHGTELNLDRNERWISVIAGGTLAGVGAALAVVRRSWAGGALAAAGGILVYRGATGHCGWKAAVEQAGRPVKLDRTFTITNKPPEEVYEFWRKLDNLPGVMENLISVTESEGGRSHWVAKGPAGAPISWNAEITNEHSGRLIEWRSAPGSWLNLAGSVRFKPKQGGGTKVHLSVRFITPGGAIGQALANLLALAAN